ncbi:MAG TPA: 30S ribosomal protein S17 [Caldisericia bacterium]|nr:30S ribosomal protein S17 [Caldisericia bacterium]HPF49289.1 30S ribosomal protein S17 [Caldisericia bacterium]HPI84031.1 30S ribosomal protein S17 [Caldisericia bacterium]HPQ93289.1 30S ribosomal protein S17 [Caldisericia bacterium]HRV75329.1 30S ribosomal protein S17 [Caldisericia bacterium]
MNDKGIVRVGKVTSDKMDKKCVVTVTRTVMHPIYKKRVQKNTKFMVHDEKNEAGIGDTIEFIDCRPTSKNCHHRFLRIVEKASLVEVTK